MPSKGAKAQVNHERGFLCVSTSALQIPRVVKAKRRGGWVSFRWRRFPPAVFLPRERKGQKPPAKEKQDRKGNTAPHTRKTKTNPRREVNSTTPHTHTHTHTPLPKGETPLGKCGCGCVCVELNSLNDNITTREHENQASRFSASRRRCRLSSSQRPKHTAYASPCMFYRL